MSNNLPIEHNIDVPNPEEPKEEREPEQCPECGGQGWVCILYPTGHHEITCNRCSGEGCV